MINVMPDDTKKQLRAARANVTLSRYILISIIAFGFLVALLFGSSFVLAQTQTSAEALIEANDTKASVFEETQTQIDQLSQDLGSARTVLDQQISYSSILRSLGTAMTPGTVLDSFELSDTAASGSPVEVRIYATNTEALTRLRDSLANSPSFSSADLGSVSSQDGIEGYPVSATMTIVINRGASL